MGIRAWQWSDGSGLWRWPGPRGGMPRDRPALPERAGSARRAGPGDALRLVPAVRRALRAAERRLRGSLLGADRARPGQVGYTGFYTLTGRPFRLGPDPRFFYPSHAH